MRKDIVYFRWVEVRSWLLPSRFLSYIQDNTSVITHPNYLYVHVHIP